MHLSAGWRESLCGKKDKRWIKVLKQKQSGSRMRVQIAVSGNGIKGVEYI